MFSSHITQKDLILAVYQSSRTVFRLNDIAMLTGITDFQSLNKKLNYYIHKGKLQNPRKGLYAKPQYNPEELACSIYTPSYISLEYVLQRAGVIFQYGEGITSVSYLSRKIEVEERSYQYRKIKMNILLNTLGITRRDNLNIATPERAFLDQVYLEKKLYFDDLHSLDKDRIFSLLPLYRVKSLAQMVTNLLQDA